MCRPILDEERLKNLPDNAMLKVRPDLWEEWDFEKNSDIDIYSVTKGISRKVWWICKDCGSSWNTSINNRTRGHNCIFCAGLDVNETNSLASLSPDLAKEWDYKKNDKTPHEVTCGARYEAWWICDKGHSYKKKVSERNSGTGCGYCSGRNVLVGFNDMWTTNPELASKLLDEDDGHKYMQGSKKRVDWKCPTCDDVIKNKVIMIVKNEGLKCPNCSDTKSYPERFMNQLLRQLGIKYIWDKETKWSKRKRYDFYLPSMSLIIETDGEQHSEVSFESMGGRTLEEEIENDHIKRELAIQNGIEHYIEIDCKYSKFEYIKNNILNSELNNLFDLSKVDWELINLNLNKSLIENIANEWNDGLINSKEISNIYKTTIKRTIQILEKATELNLCNYSKITDEYFNDKIILKLDDDLNIIERMHMESKEFDNLGYDINKINASHSSLGKYLDFYWCKEINVGEFVKRIMDKRSRIEENKKKVQAIVQLDLNGKVIRKWSNIEEILLIHNEYNKSSIENCLTRNNLTYKNYIWLKKQFYDSKEGKMYVKEKLKSMNPKMIGSKKRAVLQIEPTTGKVMNRFSSIVDAVKYIGVANSSLHKCLDRTRKTTGGYMWIRERDYETNRGKRYIKELVKWYNSK